MGNALVYGWTPRVRRLYAERFPRWCARLAVLTLTLTPTPTPTLILTLTLTRCARLAVKHVPTEHAPPTLATSESVASTTNDGGAGGNESL